jgi:hypothetical protein
LATTFHEYVVELVSAPGLYAVPVVFVTKAGEDDAPKYTS